MPGETQLRAKRTRIKILRAIADKNGAAGFSDIKALTGLSTGSIYYHLERMDDTYVTKSEKQYLITTQGIELLRQLDEKNHHSLTSTHDHSEEIRPDSSKNEFSRNEETVRHSRIWDSKFSMVVCAIAIAVALITGSQLLASFTLGLLIIHFVSKNAFAATYIANHLTPRNVFTNPSFPTRILAISALV